MARQTAIDILEAHFDMRQRTHKNFKRKLAAAQKKNDTAFLSFAKNFLMFLIGKDSANLENIEFTLGGPPEIGRDTKRNYRKDPLARCICHAPLRKAYKFNVRYTDDETTKRAGNVAGTTGLRTVGEMTLGPDHWDVFPKLVRALGDPDFAKQLPVSEEDAMQERQKQPAYVEQNLVEKLPSTFVEQLEKAGIDPEALQQVPDLLKYGPDILKSSAGHLEHLLNPANRRSWYNWFDSKIKAGEIEDENIIKAFDKLHSSIHRVSDIDVSLLLAYSYQFRTRPREGLIGNLKQELLYVRDIQHGFRHEPMTASEKRLSEYIHPVVMQQRISPAHIYKLAERPGAKQLRDILGEYDDKVPEEERTDEITVADAVALRRAFPGFDRERTVFNRSNFHVYELFADGRKDKQSLDKIFELLEGYLDHDRKAVHKNNGVWDDENTILSKSAYDELHAALSLSKLDSKKTKRQNLIDFTPMHRSQELIGRIFTEYQKMLYAVSVYDNKKALGIRKGNYQHIAAVQARYGIDLESLVEKATGLVLDVKIEPVRPFQYAPRERRELYEEQCKRYEEWKELNKSLKKVVKFAPDLEEAVQFGLVEKKYLSEARIKAMQEAQTVLNEYEKIDNDLRKKIQFLISLKPLGYATNSVRTDGAYCTRKPERFDMYTFEKATHATGQQKAVINNLYDTLMAVDDAQGKPMYARFKTARGKASLETLATKLKALRHAQKKEVLYELKQDELGIVRVERIYSVWNETADSKRLFGQKQVWKNPGKARIVDIAVLNAQYKKLENTVIVDDKLEQKMRDLNEQPVRTKVFGPYPACTFGSMINDAYDYQGEKKKDIRIAKPFVRIINGLHKKYVTAK